MIDKDEPKLGEGIEIRSNHKKDTFVTVDGVFNEQLTILLNEALINNRDITMYDLTLSFRREKIIDELLNE